MRDPQLPYEWANLQIQQGIKQFLSTERSCRGSKAFWTITVCDTLVSGLFKNEYVNIE